MALDKYFTKIVKFICRGLCQGGRGGLILALGMKNGPPSRRKAAPGRTGLPVVFAGGIYRYMALTLSHEDVSVATTVPRSSKVMLPHSTWKLSPSAKLDMLLYCMKPPA